MEEQHAGSDLLEMRHDLSAGGEGLVRADRGGHRQRADRRAAASDLVVPERLRETLPTRADGVARVYRPHAGADAGEAPGAPRRAGVSPTRTRDATRRPDLSVQAPCVVQT